MSYTLSTLHMAGTQQDLPMTATMTVLLPLLQHLSEQASLGACWGRRVQSGEAQACGACLGTWTYNDMRTTTLSETATEKQACALGSSLELAHDGETAAKQFSRDSLGSEGRSGF